MDPIFRRVKHLTVALSFVSVFVLLAVGGLAGYIMLDRVGSASTGVQADWDGDTIWVINHSIREVEVVGFSDHYGEFYGILKSPRISFNHRDYVHVAERDVSWLDREGKPIGAPRVGTRLDVFSIPLNSSGS